VIDRIIGLCGLFWLVALCAGVFYLTGHLDRLAVTPEAASALHAIALLAAAMALGSVVFWVLLGVLPTRHAEALAGRLERVPKVGTSLAELWRAVWMYRCRGRSVGLALGLAMVGHVGFVLTFYFAAVSLNPGDAVPSLGAHFLLVPVGMAIKAGVPTPGGVGGGEAGFGWLYSLGLTGELAKRAAAAGVLAALAERAIEWTLALVGYLVYLRMRPELGQPEPADRPARELARAEA
jgi:hypothetical protein